MRRLSFILVAALAALFGSVPSRASPLDPSVGRVEVTLDLPQDKPYVGEMILLRMRSFIRADVVLDEVEQPPLLNFSWQQLGRDKPVEAMIDGFRVAGIERDLALFPSTSGRLIIEPFRRQVTIVTSDGERVTTTFTSKPVYVDVQNFAAINGENAWWMPAKSVALSETWSQPPDEVKPGTLARRIITVEASGLTGERLPPPPEMNIPGTIAFRGPVMRDTIITDEGPIARGIYIWDMRPVTAAPALLPAIHVSWFDTQTRRMRDSALPETWMALVGTLVHPSHEKPKHIGLLSAGPLAVGGISFAWVAAVIVVLRGRRPNRARRREARALRQLRRLARAGDTGAVLLQLGVFRRRDPERWVRVAADRSFATELQQLDRARFARDGAPPVPLATLVDRFAHLWRDAAPAPADARPVLVSLDAHREPTPHRRSGWLAALAGKPAPSRDAA